MEFFTGLKASAGINKGYEPPAGWNFSGKFSTSQADGSSVLQANSSVTAGNTLGIISTRDTHIAGANLIGNEVVMDVGRDLNIASRVDSTNASSSAFSAGASVTVSYGSVGASVNASASQSHDSSDLVGTQTSIIGINKVDIHTDGNTDIKGAVVAALNDNLKLDTGTLTYSDIKGETSSTGFKVGGALGWKWGVEKQQTAEGAEDGEQTPSTSYVLGKSKFEPRIGDLSLTALNQGQTARATIGAGEIIVRGNPGQDLSGLNRDPAFALKMENKTGFSISITSPQVLYESVSTAFGIKDAINSSIFLWTPEKEKTSLMEADLKNRVNNDKLLEKNRITQSEYDAAIKSGDLRDIYSKKGLIFPTAFVDIAQFEVTETTPQAWQYSLFKAQTTYDRKWANLPLVDLFMPKR